MVLTMEVTVNGVFNRHVVVLTKEVTVLVMELILSRRMVTEKNRLGDYGVYMQLYAWCGFFSGVGGKKREKNLWATFSKGEKEKRYSGTRRMRSKKSGNPRCGKH